MGREAGQVTIKPTFHMQYASPMVAGSVSELTAMLFPPEALSNFSWSLRECSVKSKKIRFSLLAFLYVKSTVEHSREVIFFHLRENIFSFNIRDFWPNYLGTCYVQSA